MQSLLAGYKYAKPEEIADALVQPVEYSYTVQSLESLANSCGLELLTPAISLFDQASDNMRWNLRFNSPEIDTRYYALDDIRRWQVTNLLLCERSPMLWFYLQRADSRTPRVSEREMCNQFLDRHFVPAKTWRQGYALADGGDYQQVGTLSKYPMIPPSGIISKVVNGSAAHASVRSLFKQNELSFSFSEVNELRLASTTPNFPYLVVDRTQ